MLTTPTYLSSKLEESPVEDVTLCCYHMFTVCVYCLCLCLLSCCPLAGRGAESCSFTSALVVCRLATVCPPVWPSRAWPVWSCRVWVRELGTRGPGHRTGTQRRAERREQLQRWPVTRDETPLVSGIRTGLRRGPGHQIFRSMTERRGQD